MYNNNFIYYPLRPKYFLFGNLDSVVRGPYSHDNFFGGGCFVHPLIIIYEYKGGLGHVMITIH